ncbi:MAG: ABC transporter permease, partial [Mangrovibacterium sp.]
IILLFILFSGIQAFLGAEQLCPLKQSGQLMTAGMEGYTLEEITRMITGLNLPFLTVGFLFYFLGGFLLYSSLMGAIGAAVDNEEETQQLMLPVSLPLIFSIIILFPVAQNPEGPLAFWTSVIPFTSPVVMMVRIPFGVPLWELLLSMSILALSIWGTIWIAAKIYRTGILLYGKKVDYKEIFKWLTYRY